MSQFGAIQSLLDIIIRVSDQGIGNLNKAQSAVKQLANAQAALDRQRGDSASEIRLLTQLEQNFTATITNQARRTLEQLRIQRQITRATQEQARRDRERIVTAGQLALARGQLDRAERLFARALRQTTRNSIENLRIQQQLNRVSVERARRAREASREIVRQALVEAQLARISGNTAAEIAILNRVLARTDIESRDAARAQIALARAMQRSNQEAQNQSRIMALANAGLQRFGAVLRGITRAFNIFTRVLAAFVLIGFTIRTVARSLNRFILDPVKQITSEVLEATDAFRELQASLTGVLGSASAVRDVVRDIREAAVGLPVTTLEALGGVRGLAFTPGTAQLLSEPGPQRVEGIQNLLRILTGLATIDPQQGISGARFAVREALAGEFRSLRFRFEISPNVVAATIGRSLEDLKADPQLTLEALRTFVDQFIGDAAIDEFNRLLSVQSERLRGALQEFFFSIGDEGIYDRITGITRRAADLIQSGVDTPGGLRTARLINESLERTLDVLLDSLSVAIARITDREIDLRDDLANLNIEDIGDIAAEILDELTRLANAVITAFPDFLSFLKQFVEALPGVDLDFGAITLASANLREAELRARLNDITRFISAERQRSREAGVDFEGRRFASTEAVLFRSPLNPSERADVADQIERLNGRLATLNEQIDAARRAAPTPSEEQAALADIRGLRDVQENLEARIASLNDTLANGRVVVGPTLDELTGTGTNTGLFGAYTFSGRTLQEQQDRLRDELRSAQLRLRTIEAFTETPSTRADERSALDVLSDRAGEASSQLLKFDTLLRQSVRELPRLTDEQKTLVSNTRELSKRLADSFEQLQVIRARGQDVAEDLAVAIAAATITGDFAAIAVASQRLQTVINAEAAARLAYTTSARDVTLGVIKQSEGFTRQLPDIARIRQTIDILDVLGARQPQAVQSILSGPDARRLGADQRSILYNNLSTAIAQGGLTQDQLLDPQIIDTITRSISNLGDSVGEYTNNAEIGARVTADLADQFITLYEDRLENIRDRLADPALSQNIREDLLVTSESIQVAIEKLEELQDKALETTVAITLAFREAAEEISTSFGDGITDSLIASFEEGADAAVDVLESMFRDIQRIILRLIVEFTVLRAVVNPFLNAAFGLTGPNQLPVLGATGMVLGGGRVRGFATGGILSGLTTPGAFGGSQISTFQTGGAFITGPTAFQLAGGGLGVAGEADPEVILPLEQDETGRLGVVAAGGGGSRVVNINMTVNTPNADSFRRSARQTASRLREVM